jgi:hypothetical protein
MYNESKHGDWGTVSDRTIMFYHVSMYICMFWLGMYVYRPVLRKSINNFLVLYLAANGTQKQDLMDQLTTRFIDYRYEICIKSGYVSPRN